MFDYFHMMQHTLHAKHEDPRDLMLQPMYSIFIFRLIMVYTTLDCLQRRFDYDVADRSVFFRCHMLSVDYSEPTNLSVLVLAQTLIIPATIVSKHHKRADQYSLDKPSTQICWWIKNQSRHNIARLVWSKQFAIGMRARKHLPVFHFHNFFIFLPNILLHFSINHSRSNGHGGYSGLFCL